MNLQCGWLYKSPGETVVIEELLTMISIHLTDDRYEIEENATLVSKRIQDENTQISIDNVADIFLKFLNINLKILLYIK